MSRPATEADLADMVAAADAPFCIRGGGTRGMTTRGDVLDVSGLQGVELYEPGALTLVARAGTPVAEIEALLAAENQRLAFEPADLRGVLGTRGTPTIGAVFATNSSGPRRIQAGAARDFLLGVRYVDGMGQVIRNGGRVMKNVTGYDLVKLMAGAHGTLGVLSEVSLKVLPKAECSGTLVWHGLGWEAALRIFCDAMKSPYDVTGAARLPEQGDQPSRTLIRVEGFEASVRYRLEQLARIFAKLGPDDKVLDAADNAQLWQGVRDVGPFRGRLGNVWKTSVKPTDMVRVTGTGDYEHVVDWGGGLIWTLAPHGIDLRAELAGVEGHVTLVRAGSDVGDGPGEGARIFDQFDQFGRFHPQSGVLAAVSIGLRARFDPRGLFNPGLME